MALFVKQRKASGSSGNNRMGGPFSAYEALPIFYLGTSAGQGVVPLSWVILVPFLPGFPNGSELQCGVGSIV